MVALAVLSRVVAGRERPTRAVVLLTAAGAAALVVLVATNPYLVVEFELARDQLTGQSSHAATAKLGQDGAAWSYYPRTLLWGFGVVPTLFAAIGTVVALSTSSVRARTVLLVAFPALLYAYLSTQERFFGRWLLSAYPALAILAGYGVVRAAGWWRQRVPRLRARTAACALPVLVGLTLAQPVFDSVRSDVVLGHTDTRTLALEWIHANLEDRRIVVEPSVPSDYLEDEGFVTFPIDRPYQAYETRLGPDLVDDYRSRGYCWVLVSSHQRDRGLAADLDGSRAYYERLTGESDRVVVFSPYHPGATPPDFSYDLSFNWYPLAHRRPGPYLELRHLSECTPGEGADG